MFIMFFMLLVFFLGWGCILFNTRGVLSVLISLEFLVMVIFIMMIMVFMGEGFLELLVFLVLAVSESLLGLVVLVLMVGVVGEDSYMKSYVN